MAYEIPGQMVTLAASTDFTGSQYTFKSVGSDGRLTQPTTGSAVFGVLQNKPLEDQAGTLMITGISKVKAAASTLSVGDSVATDASGLAVVPGAGDYTIGRVIAGSSGGANRVLTVELTAIGTT